MLLVYAATNIIIGHRMRTLKERTDAERKTEPGNNNSGSLLIGYGARQSSIDKHKPAPFFNWSQMSTTHICKLTTR